jgi:hypothetical protein
VQIALFVLGSILVLVAVAAVVIVRRAGEFGRLVQDGIETTGVVEEKLVFGGGAGTRKGKHLRYAYKDDRGREHRFRSQVTEGRYEQFAVGDPIDIVYSRGNPAVSAPKWLIDEAKAAREKKR